jgi:hypothetical protein
VFSSPEPGLIFGASTGFVGRDGFGLEKNGSAFEILAIGEDIGDRFQIGFDEAHGGDFDSAARFDEENGGDHSEAVGVRNRVIPVAIVGRGRVANLIGENGKGDPERLGEVTSSGDTVLGYAQKGDVIGLIALVEPFEEGKGELADRAGDFEKAEDHGTFFERVGKRELAAVERFEREVGSGIAPGDVGHAVVIS